MSVSVLSFAVAHLLRLNIRVSDADWVGTYDRLEVWRSVLGEGGPYQELSAPSWEQAVLPATAGLPAAIPGPSVNIVGRKLTLAASSQASFDTVFTGTDPLTMAQAASQVAAASHGSVSAYVDTTGQLVLQTLPVGGLASLLVVGGDAAPILGLNANDIAFGSDPRIVLSQGTTSYFFQDYYSDRSYFYKTRFSNSRTGVKSDFSDPFSATARMGVDPSQIAIGYVQLAFPDGRVAAKQEVTIYNAFNAKTSGGFTVVGGPQKLLTDDNGYVEFPLIRGITVDVGIGGTSLIRRVSVPTDATVLKFDVFDPQYGQDDNFIVQRADLPYADRKTL